VNTYVRSSLSQEGRIAIIGLLASDRISLPVLSLLGNRASMAGNAVGPRRAPEGLVRTVDLLGIRPVIETTYSFSHVPQAFAHVQRGAFGKIVVQMSEG
jgi:D-arabinose 1-dehydrogenase-like Zn-dependent alcohol dehydrogenase